MWESKRSKQCQTVPQYWQNTQTLVTTSFVEVEYAALYE